MISTDITGGNGTSQLLDLLSLVSNPAVYEAKVKALQEAIAQNKAYVEAVAPVSEILAIRQKVEEEREQSQKEVKDARAEATKVKADAKAAAKVTTDKADKILADAQEQATKLLAEAQKELNDAKSSNAALKAQIAAASAAE